MNLSSVCICGRHHPCRYDYGDDHGLGSYFRDDPGTPIRIADDNEAHKAELVLCLPYEEQDNGNRDEMERALATYRTGGSGTMADNQVAQYEGLRDDYLAVRRALSEERWKHGGQTERARLLMDSRAAIRAEIEPLAKSLKRTDWPPTPWEK